MNPPILTRLAALVFLIAFSGGLGAEPSTMVGAYYYPWYDNAGFNSSGAPGSNCLIYHLNPRMTPELGWYNQNDAAVISQHYEWAHYAGIDFFVCSYWGEGSRTDNIIRSRMFDNPDRGGMKLCVFMEPGITPQGGSSAAVITSETNYLCDNYFNQPGYFHLDGKPVVFIYVTRAMTDAELTLCVDTIRSAAALKGVDVYIAGDEVWGAPNTPVDGPRVAQLEAITNYDVYGNLGAARFVTDSKLDQWQSRNTGWKNLANGLGVDFIPAISPGYNDTAVRSGHQPCSRKLNDENGDFGSYFSGLIDRLEPAVGMVMINSWNEWHEDTQIEPIPVAAVTTLDDGGGSYTDGLEYEGYGLRYLDLLRAEFFTGPIRCTTSGDYLTPGTWDGGAVPGQFNQARINGGGNTVTLSGTAPDILNLQAGHSESGSLVIASGGSLTSTGWTMIGSSGSGVTGALTVEAGGVMHIDSHLWVGVGGSTGVVDINGGTVNVGGIIGLGTVNAVDPSGGFGFVNVNDGGLLALSNIHALGTSVQPGSLIHISGTGRMTLPGNFTGVINSYIANGYIAGNGVPDAAALNVAYDAGASETSVTAVPVAPFILTVTRDGAGFMLSWPSRTGMRYNLRSSETLAGAYSSWEIVEEDIAATPDTNTWPISPTAQCRFYVIEQIAPTIPAP